MRKFLLVLGIISLTFLQSNANQDDFYTYLKQLKSNVELNWKAPDLPALYTTEVNFQVLKDGSIKNAKVVKSSGSKTLDSKALAAVVNSGSQAPLPAVYKSNSIDVTMQLSSRHTASAFVKTSKKSYRKTTKVVEARPVKIKKVIYDEKFTGASNYQDKMIQPVLNLNIQNSLRK